VIKKKREEGNWLGNFPYKDVKKLVDTFVGSLAQYYQNRISE
jgi:hypothetical protein